MLTSWRRLLSFNNFFNGFVSSTGQQFTGWLALHPEETKFHYAVKRVLDQIETINKKIQVEFEDIDLDHCSTVLADPRDPKSDRVIVRDDRGEFRFTPENHKKARALRNELLNVEDIEIEPHFATELPESVTDDDEVRSILVGFVIREEEAQALEEQTAPAGPTTTCP